MSRTSKVGPNCLRVSVCWANPPLELRKPDLPFLIYHFNSSKDQLIGWAKEKILKFAIDSYGTDRYEKIQNYNRSFNQKFAKVNDSIDLNHVSGPKVRPEDDEKTLEYYNNLGTGDIGFIFETKEFGTGRVFVDIEVLDARNEFIVDLGQDTIGSLRSTLLTAVNPKYINVLYQVGTSPILRLFIDDDENIGSAVGRDGNLFILQLRSSTNIVLNIRSCDMFPMYHRIIIKPDERGLDIKNRIFKLTNIPIKRQILWDGDEEFSNSDRFALGKELENNEFPLSITLTKTEDTGGPYSQIPVFSDEKKLQLADISHSAHIRESPMTVRLKSRWWRITLGGLNFEAICGNNNCLAFTKQIVAPWGHQPFNLKFDLTKVKCPLCLTNVKKILTFSFTNCHWKMYGMKKNGSDCETKWNTAGNSYNTVYGQRSLTKSDGISLWSHLFIVTLPLKSGFKTLDVPNVCGGCLETIVCEELINTCLTSNHSLHIGCDFSTCIFCSLKNHVNIN